ncbi:MAG: hypothetical protein M1826_007021 [Phylliscum demangeonii]|nr:MAG: hypothetical protein M1826_007021 [Phylliscum demangeonii]
MCPRLTLVGVILFCCRSVCVTAASIEKKSTALPIENPLDEYGYGLTLESDRRMGEEWIEALAMAKEGAALKRYGEPLESAEEWWRRREEYLSRTTTYQRERLYQVALNNRRIEQEIVHTRTRRAKGAGKFTPANDADYEFDVQQIQLDYEHRMAESENNGEKPTPLTFPPSTTEALRERAQKTRDQSMINAYERHDLRKNDWTQGTQALKRQIARLRHAQSEQRRAKGEKEIQLDGDEEYEEGGSSSRPSRRLSRLDKLLETKELAYARQRPMPSVAKQKAGLLPPEIPPESSPPPPPASPSPHQLALLPSLEKTVVGAARSSLHQLEHAAQSLGPSLFAWEKRASKSRARAVSKVGPLEGAGAELKAATSW